MDKLRHRVFKFMHLTFRYSGLYIQVHGMFESQLTFLRDFSRGSDVCLAMAK